MSGLENAPSRVEVGRLTAALVDIFCRSFPARSAAITLDIDEICDAEHGHPSAAPITAPPSFSAANRQGCGWKRCPEAWHGEGVTQPVSSRFYWHD